MNHKDTIGRERQTRRQRGEREEERLKESQGCNRKERDRLTGKGGRLAERKRDSLTHKDTVGSERDRLPGKGGRQRGRETGRQKRMRETG